MSCSPKDATVEKSSLFTYSTARSDYISRRLQLSGYSRIIQNFRLLWVDSNIDETNNETGNTITQLRSIVNTISIFNDTDQCIHFLNEVKDEKLFMIISSVFASDLIPPIHNAHQLYSIYIFCQNDFTDEQWTKDWLKVKGIYTEFTSICKSLEQDAKQCEQNLIPISFVPSSDEVLIENLDQLDQSFMYTQIFKDILLEMKYDEQSIKDFAIYCRHGNYGELNKINRFEREYHAQTPIWWYTSEGFLYSMLNRALRTMEIDTIIKIGFFVHDLHHHIDQIYQEQFGNEEKPQFTVYRGQCLSIENFEKIMKSKGGLLSFNNFLSTSKDRDISLIFADSNLISFDIIRILFEITVNPSISSTPYALIKDLSSFGPENEVLFSMHTVFRIENITQLDHENHILWQIGLKLTSDSDQQLNILTKRIREETYPGSSGWHRMGELLIKLGESDKAEQIYNPVLNDTCDDLDKALLCNMLGMVKCDQSKYIEALAFYQKSFEIHLKNFPPNHPRVAASHLNIGTVFFKMEEYSQALSSYEKALEIYEIILPSNHHNLGIAYNNIGMVYDYMADYSKALPFYEKALEIRQKTLPENHPSLATSYNNIGSVYQVMGEYSKARSFLEKTLEIFQKVLPPNHPDMALPYENIGVMYDHTGEYPKALLFYEKALEIQQKMFPSHHPALAISYNNIGVVYGKTAEYSKALLYHKKSLDIKQKILPPNYLDLALSYNNIGSVYDAIGEYTEALSFYEKAFEIHQKILPQNHPDLVYSYNNIGVVYRNMGEYSKACSFLEKVLEISQIILSPNHPDLATAYNNMGIIYTSMGECSKSLLFYEKALEIRRQVLPRNHPSLAVSHNNIGTIYFQMGEYSKALSSLQEAFDIKQKTLSLNHPSMADAYNNIGSVYKKMEEYAKALYYQEKALEIRQNTLPSNHPSIAISYNNIGLVYMSMKEYSKALTVFENAVHIRQNDLRSDHPDLACYYNNIGLVYKNLGENSKAVPFFERAVNIGQHSLPTNHPDIQLWKINLESVKNN